MFTGKPFTKQPMAYCAPCAERTPHRYERHAVNGRLTSKAICLICNNDSRRDAALHKTACTAS
jgi:hypothetical protein